MTTQLDLYNEALGILAERSLTSLAENREPRRVLDEIWARGAKRYCLEQGQWCFAIRTAKITSEVGFMATFGYQEAFILPSDWVRATSICSDEFLTSPLLNYTEEVGMLFSDVNAIYVSYVSDAATFGGNLAIWPETFTRYVACYLAASGCSRISNDKTLLEKLVGPKGNGGALNSLLVNARSKTALESPTKFLPAGSWSTARARGSYSGRDVPGGTLY